MAQTDRLDESALLRRMGEADVIEWMDQKSRPFRNLMAYYRCAIMEVETKFNVLNEELSLQYDRNPIESIRSRLKSPASILDKLRRKGIPPSLAGIEDGISDVAGIRVVCSFPEDITMLTECLLRQDDITLIRKKDYIRQPKPTGYRSMHLIVEIPIFLSDEKKRMKVEVQLRTIAMDAWASLEHKIRYKKGLAEDPAVARELYECAEIASQLDLRMDAIRKRLEKA